MLLYSSHLPLGVPNGPVVLLHQLGSIIDPDKIHIKTLTDNPKETEENLLRFLTDQNFYDHKLFPYNFK
jgi:hypothetical protein